MTRPSLPELLSIDLPLILAPMAGVQGSALAIAVSEAGALGSLPCAMLAPEALRDELEQRTKVMRERNVIRREAAQVAVLTGVLVTGASLFAPPSLPVDDDGAAQVLPLLLAIAFVVATVFRVATPVVARAPEFLRPPLRGPPVRG